MRSKRTVASKRPLWWKILPSFPQDTDFCVMGAQFNI